MDATSVKVKTAAVVAEAAAAARTAGVRNLANIFVELVVDNFFSSTKTKTALILDARARNDVCGNDKLTHIVILNVLFIILLECILSRLMNTCRSQNYTLY